MPLEPVEGLEWALGSPLSPSDGALGSPFSPGSEKESALRVSNLLTLSQNMRFSGILTFLRGVVSARGVEHSSRCVELILNSVGDRAGL